MSRAPDRPQREARIRALVDGLPEAPSIMYTVRIPQLSPHPIDALIDTGATDSFFSKEVYSKRFEYPSKQTRKNRAVRVDPDQHPFYLLKQIPRPIPLRMFDGNTRSELKDYLPSTIGYTSDKEAEVPLFETCLPRDCPVILGMDFLRLTRPQVDWDNCTLIFPITPDPDSA